MKELFRHFAYAHLLNKFGPIRRLRFFLRFEIVGFVTWFIRSRDEIQLEERGAMSSREMIIGQVTARMIEVFTKGDLIDAQNIEAFITSLEAMEDEEYLLLESEECSGAIS